MFIAIKGIIITARISGIIFEDVYISYPNFT